MAQPKIIAGISKLAQNGYLDGSVLLGSLSSNSTLLDTVLETGMYIFIGTTTTPLTCSSACAWVLRVYAPDPDNSSSATNYSKYIIQEAEKLGTTADGTNSRLIAYREYNGTSWSAWYEGGGGGKVECDTAMSTTSENPVQNKVIAAALAGKSDTNHTHSTYATTTALANKLDKSGGTLTGALVAQANTNYTTYQVRNIALNTSASTPTGNGSILGVYS